jgi:hypothetical protein
MPRRSTTRAATWKIATPIAPFSEVPLDRKLQQAHQDEAEEDRLAEREHDRDEQKALQERRASPGFGTGRDNGGATAAKPRERATAATPPFPVPRAVRRCDLRLVMPALAGEPPVDGDAGAMSNEPTRFSNQ